MKKLFLLALIVLMVCNVLFASEVKSTDTLNLSLNLGTANSVVKVGFTGSTPALEKITSKSDDITELNELSITIDTASDLMTSANSFYVYWYINAIKKASNNISSLELTFENFLGETVDTETIPYNIVCGTPTKDGQSIEIATDKTVSSTTGKLAIIEQRNDLAGVYKGFLPISIPPFSYSGFSAQNYITAMTLTLIAP